MQPYPYGAYPNAHGAAMSAQYMVPPNYQRSYPPSAVPSGYRPEFNPVGLPPPPMSVMMPIMSSPRPQHQPEYRQQVNNPREYHRNPAVSTDSKKDPKGSKHNRAIGAENKRIQDLLGNNELRKHKGTKLKESKTYQISKKKSDEQKNDSSDNDESLNNVRPVLFSIQSSSQDRPPLHNDRILSAASSCSHCSTCSNCSCSHCRDTQGGHIYDDCPECRAEQEREQARHHKHK
jgi:hypothetical protein